MPDKIDDIREFTVMCVSLRSLYYTVCLFSEITETFSEVQDEIRRCLLVFMSFRLRTLCHPD